MSSSDATGFSPIVKKCRCPNCREGKRTSVRLHNCHFENCGKNFPFPSLLNQHLRKHTGERPYACKSRGCDKKFLRNSELNRHGLVHLRARREKVPKTKVFKLGHACDRCGKKFPSRSALKKHVLVHTGGEKNYACDMCGYRSAWRDNFRRHVRVHGCGHDKVNELRCGVDENARRQIRMKDLCEHHLRDLDQWWPKDLEKLSFSDLTEITLEKRNFRDQSQRWEPRFEYPNEWLAKLITTLLFTLSLKNKNDGIERFQSRYCVAKFINQVFHCKTNFRHKAWRPTVLLMCNTSGVFRLKVLWFFGTLSNTSLFLSPELITHGLKILTKFVGYIAHSWCRKILLLIHNPNSDSIFFRAVKWILVAERAHWFTAPLFIMSRE